MWIVVYVSASKYNVEKLVKALEENNIISRVRPTNSNKNCFEVLVPQTELSIAQELIFEEELF